jgi:hypothetical protein
MNATEHIAIAKGALRFSQRRATPWAEDGYVDVPPSAESVALAQAYAAVAQAEALAEVVAELRALREAVTRLAEQQPETARRWFRRRRTGGDSQ